MGIMKECKVETNSRDEPTPRVGGGDYCVVGPLKPWWWWSATTKTAAACPSSFISLPTLIFLPENDQAKFLSKPRVFSVCCVLGRRSG